MSKIFRVFLFVLPILSCGCTTSLPTSKDEEQLLLRDEGVLVYRRKTVDGMYIYYVKKDLTKK